MPTSRDVRDKPVTNFQRKFHCADLPRNFPGLKGTSQVCRGLVGEVGIVEFGLNSTRTTTGCTVY